MRGCGERQEAGIYITIDQSAYGAPIESFIVDSPVPVTPASLGLGARGRDAGLMTITQLSDALTERAVGARFAFRLFGHGIG